VPLAKCPKYSPAAFVCFLIACWGVEWPFSVPRSLDLQGKDSDFTVGDGKNTLLRDWERAFQPRKEGTSNTDDVIAMELQFMARYRHPDSTRQEIEIEGWIREEEQKAIISPRCNCKREHTA
jgi:hypothetical protein